MDKKTSAWIQLIASSCIVVLLTAILIYGIARGGFPFISFNIGGGWHYAHSDKYSVGSGEITPDGGSLKAINVNWLDGSVDIVGSATASAITVEEQADRDLPKENQVHYWYHDGILDLQYRESSSGFNISFGRFGYNKHLTVTVPEHLCQPDSLELKTDAVSSDINIKNINAKSFDTDSVSGVIRYEGSVSTAINCDTVSGDINVTSHLAPSSVEVDCVSANTTLLIPSTAEFHAKYDGVSGRLSFDGFDASSRGENEYDIGNGNGNHYEFDSVSGDVTIRAVS